MIENRLIDRRGFLDWGVHGIGATALLSLLNRDGVVKGAEKNGKLIQHHFPARAKRAVHICLIGGMSHLDSFDYKPELEKHHGKPLGTDEKPDIFFGKVGLLRRSDWKFHQRGESGLWTSDMFPNIAKNADDLTVIRSMVSESANHTPALFFANSGFQFNGYPSVGSWLSYGLGSESDELPVFVVLPDGRGGPNGGASNWSSGFLPTEHQGVILQGGAQPVRDLFPSRKVPKGADADIRSFLEAVNRKHLDRVGENQLLSARIRSYELAARMQLSVPEVSALDGEPGHIADLYGLEDKQTAECARRCLLARRLLERGVRFVQIFSGGPIAGSPRASWDAHENVKENHTAEATRIDRPVAALLQDLKQRGMLDDTLVLFTTEFGRTPLRNQQQTR